MKKNWTGRYADTREATETLEEDLKRAIEEGRYRSELSGGGTLDERYYMDGGFRIDAYFPSNSKKGYSHDRVSSKNGYEHFHD
jgi:hypothetical protein